MKIGIDISQIVYEKTGVERYVRSIVRELIASDKDNEYILFGASLRRAHVFTEFVDSLKSHSNVRLVVVRIPPTILEFLWNRLHIIPVEWFIGPVDVFWSSDWTQPPLCCARGVTTIHDVSFLHFPASFARLIISVQKRRLYQAKKECVRFFCDSHATKKDLHTLLNIPDEKMTVIYPGISL